MDRNQPTNYDYAPPNRTSGLAIASLVLGILGLTCISILGAIPAVICGHVALSNIKDSRGALGGRGLGIAGLVTGYVGMVLGFFLLTAIAIPNFIRARNMAIAVRCENNLRQIDQAKNQWALEHNAKLGAVPSETDLKPYLTNGLPACPGGGTYTIGPVGSDPACSNPQHRLSQFSPANTEASAPVERSIVVSTVSSTAPQPAIPANAVGYFIPAKDRADMVPDTKSNILYISAAGSVLRYRLTTKQFLPPLALGGDLRGMDISPDNKTLAVADAAGGNGQILIHLVDLSTGTDKPVSFSAAMQESGTFAVAFGADGQVWISSSMRGSGFLPLRRYNPANGTFTKFQSVSQDTMLTASADRQRIAFAESHMSPGSYGQMACGAAQLPSNPMRADFPVYEIGISRDGTQLAVPTYQNLILAGSSVPSLAEREIIAAVYHPQHDYLFVARAGTSLVSVYSTANYLKVKDLDFGEQFDWVGNQAFKSGRLRLSQDGKYLFCTVNGGVRYAETGL